jgi:hypothetical protein
MSTALGMKIQSQIKHLIFVLALVEIPIMLALCVRTYVLPCLFWVEVQQCLLDLF